jgi:hypothetical protein
MSRKGCDPTQFLFPSAGFVRRRQTQRHAKGVLSARRCKLAAIAELMTIPNAGDDCRGGHSADAWYGGYQADPRILLGDLLEPIFIPSDSSVKRHEMLTQIMDHLIGNIGQVSTLPVKISSAKPMTRARPFAM